MLWVRTPPAHYYQNILPIRRYNIMYDFNKVIEKNPPLLEVDYFFDSLKSACKVKKARSGQKFSLEDKNRRLFFILFEGTGLVKRVSDSMVISTIHGPSIIGLQDVFHQHSELQISAATEMEYSLIAVEDFFQWAEDNHLWKNLCYLLMLTITRFSDYQKETVGVSNYELICNLLNSLNNETFEIRATTTAVEYIKSRSMLSRSGIMRTLSCLKYGGYITTNKGLLVKMNTLPKKF